MKTFGASCALGTVCFLLIVEGAPAQQPRLANARQETRSASAGLERVFRALLS